MKLEGAARVYAPVVAVLWLVLVLFLADRLSTRPFYTYTHHRAAPGVSGPTGARYRLDHASASGIVVSYLSGDIRRAGFSFDDVEVVTLLVPGFNDSDDEGFDVETLDLERPI